MEKIQLNIPEQKSLDNALLQKYQVKLYGSDRDTYDIRNTCYTNKWISNVS